MGMFDSFYINVECPFCKKESKVECQTKDLDCNLNVFNIGDFIGSYQYEFLDCIADCRSKECLEYEEKDCGYKSGFGRMFYLNVFIDNGIVSGKYAITKLL